MNKQSTFGKADRFPKLQIYSENFVVGDPTHIQQIKFGGPSFPKSQRRIFGYQIQTPGPGNYNIADFKSIKQQADKLYRVNREFMDYMKSRPRSVQQNNPGPGAYDLGSTIRKRGISFTKARVNSFHIEQSPGPGQYTISRPISRVQ
ncbi:unnamed protein product [Paramecium octaurelia]|uniref:Uncharacterized protein n=1 Tax=Paramecium octaurelia TaxID=43137 RepID=A0A8S1W0D9_PAROT|nr:unnamed protein product [Paramecium octaurelia]